MREAIGRPGAVRPGWSVLAELCERVGAGLDAEGSPAVTAELAKAVAFYEGVTLDEIGGRGVRWQERDAAAKAPAAELPEAELETPPELPEGMRLDSVSSLWEGRETEHAPALRFLAPHPFAELSPADAERLGVHSGDDVFLSANGHSVRAAAKLRSGVQPGSVFLVGANGLPRSVEVRKA